NSVTDTDMTATSLTSNSPYVAAGGGPMTVDNATCNATTVPACTFNGTTFSVANFNLTRGTTRTFTLQAVMQGLGAGCAQVTNPLTSTNALNVISHAFASI